MVVAIYKEYKLVEAKTRLKLMFTDPDEIKLIREFLGHHTHEDIEKMCSSGRLFGLSRYWQDLSQHICTAVEDAIEQGKP